jgi:large subunit ribosomal protein L35
MPKQKSHSGAKKRFKVTGAGKLLRRRAMKSHYLSKKSEKRKRKFRRDQPLHPTNVRAVKRLLGGVKKT